ncbi:MAG TPA: amino acid--tRNA ligase-related protein [Solirubrobacterales bacterium]|nr:amino acid--tRNA ligase-related protein [Solirubrobacterales bacterium]
MSQVVGSRVSRPDGAIALRVGDPTATPKEAAVMAERRDKIERLRSSGSEPFAKSFPDRTDTASLQEGELEDGSTLRVAGRLVGRRHHGQIVFMDVRDGSGEVQVLCLRDELDLENYARIADIDVGDIIGVEGEVTTSKRGERLVKARSLTILGKALLMPPQRGAEQKGWRSDRRELDVIAGDSNRAMLRTRSALNAFLRRWFDTQDFIEVDTPVLLPLASGAAARPFVTEGHALGSNLYMRIAIEQSLKRWTIGGFEQVYELGRCFRNEGMSKRHHFEFTMLEWMKGYTDYQDTMDIVEEVVSSAAEEVIGKLQFERGDKVFDLSRPWRRTTVREAILQKTGADVMSADRGELVRMLGVKHSDTNWSELVAAVYGKLVEPTILQPTFVTDFPGDLFPLAKRRPDTPELAESFEAVIAGVEIATGITSQNDVDEQRTRFAEQQARAKQTRNSSEGLSSLDEDFLRTLAHGMMPATGAGLGLDRVLMLLMERSLLRDVIPFPTLQGESANGVRP